MTIKKTIKVKPTGSPQPAGAPASGGAAIADRFKLDAPVAQKASTGKATSFAVAAGLIALAVAGILTYILWQHWEFLMPA